MTLAYFDTSVLVKNYVREAGSGRARELLGRYAFLSSAVSPIEIGSALRRRFAQGEISKSNYLAILNRVKRDRAHWELVEATPQVLTRAEGLVLNYDVRTLDALHLASALIVRDSIGASLPFVTAHGRQLEAARQCGLETIAVSV